MLFLCDIMDIGDKMQIIEFKEKYFEDVKDISEELEEYILTIDEDEGANNKKCIVYCVV